MPIALPGNAGVPPAQASSPTLVIPAQAGIHPSRGGVSREETGVPPASNGSGLVVPFAGGTQAFPGRTVPGTPVSDAALIRPNRVRPREPIPQREKALGGRRAPLRKSDGGGLAGSPTRAVRRIDPRVRIVFDLEADFPRFDAKWNL